MMLVVSVLLLALPFLELWTAIEVAGTIGVLPTFALIVLLSMSGVWLLRRQGVSVWRRANAEMTAGRMPTRSLLDGALVLVGGVSLVLPGFVTGAFGLLLMLPPVRALLRPLLLAWMSARAARAVRSGRLGAVFVDGRMGPDGRIRTTTRSYGDVMDAEGWDVGDGPGELDRPARASVDDEVIDVEAIDEEFGGADGPDPDAGGPGTGGGSPR